MSSEKKVIIVLKGLWRLNRAQRLSIKKWIREGFEPIVKEAAKSLEFKSSMKAADRKELSKTQYLIEMEFNEPKPPKKRCGLLLAECGSGHISIGRHKFMGVCGNDEKARRKRFLTTDELLGHALANTALHEIGHLVANFDDNRISGNFMSTLGPPKDKRTVKTQRAFWASKMSWTKKQEEALIKNIKLGKKAFDDEFTVTPIPAQP